MSASHALLGILTEGPKHGYELKREHDLRFPGTRPLAYAQVYATLGRLERDGLVEVAETSQGGGPERTTYAISEQGRASLDEWLGEVESPGPYPADDLVRKTLTALHLGADATGFLARQRAAHLGRMRELVSLQQGQSEPGARIGLDHTISHLDADLRWLETAATRVAAARNGTPGKARGAARKSAHRTTAQSETQRAAEAPNQAGR